MDTPNDFRAIYQSITITELLNILDNPEKYQPLAIKAAEEELANRQLSDIQIFEARLGNKPDKFRKEKEREKANVVENKIKAACNTFMDSINPIRSEIPSTEKTIRIIVIFFSFLFAYLVISNFRLLTLMIKSTRFDFIEIMYFLPYIIIPITTILFWLGKKAGWILMTFLVTYLVIEILKGLWRSIVSFGAEPDVFENLFPRPSMLSYIVQLIFWGGMLYVICKPNIKAVFKIGNQIMLVTIIVGILASVFL